MTSAATKRPSGVTGTTSPYPTVVIVTVAHHSVAGTLPKVAPSDPQGALKTTTATVKGYYNGWPFTLRKSQLANWKPKGKGPYTVGVLFDGLSNPFQAYVFNSLQKFLTRARARQDSGVRGPVTERAPVVQQPATPATAR